MTPSAQYEDWQAHQAFALKFYSTPKAIAIWQRHVRTLVERRNSVSGLRYGADPTILSWQLANEPRALNQGSAYRKWIETSAAFIRSIDCYHLVSLGSEGPTPWPGCLPTRECQRLRIIHKLVRHDNNALEENVLALATTTLHDCK